MLGQLGVQADLVYVDAAHEYMPVKRDYAAFWPLVSDRGAMVGDDYAGKFEGVTRAAIEFAGEIGRPLLTRRHKFILDKGGAFADVRLT